MYIYMYRVRVYMSKEEAAELVHAVTLLSVCVCVCVCVCVYIYIHMLHICRYAAYI